MADYTKVYDGAAKDTAESTITGADFDVEFNAIETAIGTKADKDVPVAANSIGLLDVNGNLLSSEVLISTDGTLADDSDAAVPTEKAVKTYVDAQKQTWVSGTFTLGSISPTSSGTAKVAHGLGDVAIDFGGSYYAHSGVVEDVRLFAKYGGNTHAVIIDQGSHPAYSTPSLVNGEIGVIAYNKTGTFTETGVTIRWWIRLR